MSAFGKAVVRKDGTIRLKAKCKRCEAEYRASPERRAVINAQRKAKRELARGGPAKRKEFCPQGHPRTPENLRPNSYSCKICHREQQLARDRARGIKPRATLGGGWSCGHDPTVSVRYSKGKPKGCKECHREKERQRPYDRERTRRYYEANKAQIDAYRKAWRSVNRHSSAEYKAGGRSATRYAALIKNDPCVYCGGPSGEIDHISPVSKGGTGEWMNLAPICRSCNASKSAKDVLHFLLRRSSKDSVPA